MQSCQLVESTACDLEPANPDDLLEMAKRVELDPTTTFDRRIQNPKRLVVAQRRHSRSETVSCLDARKFWDPTDHMTDQFQKLWQRQLALIHDVVNL